MTKKIAFVGLLGVVLCLPACAQNSAAEHSQIISQNQAIPSDVDPQKLEMSREIIQLTRSDAVFKNAIEQISKGYSAALARDNPQNLELINLLIDKYFVPTFMEHIAELYDNTAVQYAQTFSREELQDILAFYRSPSGKRWVVMMPIIGQQSGPFIKEWSLRNSQIAVQKLLDQIKQNNLTIPKEIGAGIK